MAEANLHIMQIRPFSHVWIFWGLLVWCLGDHTGKHCSEMKSFAISGG